MPLLPPENFIRLHIFSPTERRRRLTPDSTQSRTSPTAPSARACAAAEADALRAAARAARNSSFWYGGDRPRWLGPISYDYPEHLTGEYPGDYGFDIAGLGRDHVGFWRLCDEARVHGEMAEALLEEARGFV